MLIEKDKLLADWIGIVKNYATNVLGLDTSAIDGGADMWLANVMSRLPSIMPRQVRISDIFKYSEELEAGWLNLKDKIEKGEDLAPFLSRGTLKLDGTDGMLAHWGINHFHLGIEKDLKYPTLVQGGKYIVYAILENDTFYAISIAPHGHWQDTNLLNITKRNWPNMRLFKNSIASFEPEFNDEQLKNARKDNFNVVFKLDDGRPFMTRGVTLAGTDSFSALKACNVRRIWMVEQQKIEDRLKKQGNSYKNKINATLILNDDASTFSVEIPELNEVIPIENYTIQGLISNWRT